MSISFRTAAAALLLTALPLSVCAQGFRDLAPADEYFGRMKLSVLGIANMIHDADARIAYDRARIEPEFNGTLAFVTDAIHAWETKYPRDPWISRDLLALSRAYMHSGSERGVQLARQTVSWLTRDYPSSRAARAAQSELAAVGAR